MQHIVSTNAGRDVSEEYAEQAQALIEGAGYSRTTERDEDFYIRLHHPYAAPDGGGERWAVDYYDDASRELEEYGSEEEAEARYEELVREAAMLLGEDNDGALVRFSATDVDGVPGPLPALPDISPGDVRTLIDVRAEEPVMYLVRTEDGEGGELELAFGPAALVSHHQVVLTREKVLETLSLYDGDTVDEWVTASSVPGEDIALLEMLALAARDARVLAADSLFPPAADPR
ncbi:hypothetical protein ACIQRC_34165 [Streptomyces californicus]|uniref:hypothetical protein n=1 Tax=Streptomyces californicus TaxID=67351 RepID=UPI0037F38DC0